MTAQAAARPRSDYGRLLAEVSAAGLLQRRASRYLARLAALSVVSAGGVLALLALGNSWWQLPLAALFAGIAAQVGFLGHDAGHQQVFRSRRANDSLGLLLAGLGLGLSYGWWVDKHNRHHQAPNQVDHDPDVAPGVLAWTSSQAAGQSRWLQWLVRRQAALFVPLLVLEAWNLHVGSVRAVLRRRAAGEGAVLLAHATVVVGALLLVMSPAKVALFVVVQQSLFGLYLGCSFAPNHKGMPVTEAGDPGERDFLRRQVLTARDVRGGRVLTAAFGGLNLQIEHHLFPSMPSPNLRRCRPLVKAFCHAQGLPYTETTLLDSYRQALRHLHAVAPHRSG